MQGYEESLPGTALAESMRNFGYDLNTAVCDIIDNSVTANAESIMIWLEWNDGAPYVCILDNGHGMTDEELSRNIVMGSKDPGEEREKGDLGRFGLGLKTASLSMCRNLNVFSKTASGSLAFRGWDLDKIKEQGRWLVATEVPDWYSNLEGQFRLGDGPGTLVVWKNCDRLKEIANNLQSLQNACVALQEYIGTYFYRFLIGQAKISITVNGTPITPWNPIPPNSVSKAKASFGAVEIQPFLVPKKSDFDDEQQFIKAGGLKGWNAQQGFYVYRNNRLLINGGWLNFKRMKNDEHTKLARIVVDIDSTMDLTWGVDVQKSKARVPDGPLRDHLRSIAQATRVDADAAYRRRGGVRGREKTATDKFMWKAELNAKGSRVFLINRESLLVKSVMENHRPSREIDRLLSLIERTLPIEHIQVAVNEEKCHRQNIDFDELKAVASEQYKLLREAGISKKNAANLILYQEPFSEFRQELMELFGIDDT